MIDETLLWVEKYRPKTIKDCILPAELKATFQAYADKKEIPNLILTGTPGVGKTTIARALCEEVDADYILINGSNENGVDTLRMKILGFATSVSLTGGRKVIIMDEADAITGAAQSAFRGVIEEVADNCSFIFTCNFVHKLMDAIHSRCAVINFKLQADQRQKMAMAFMKRIEEILTLEKIQYDKRIIAELITKFFPDYRRALNELQRFSISGKIDSAAVSQIGNANIDELIKYIKAKDFKGLRKWVGSNSDIDSTELMKSLYDKAYDFFSPQSVPALVVITGKYLYQSALVADQEINMAAWLTEIMVECQVKE